jgi:hypothetical protein
MVQLHSACSASNSLDKNTKKQLQENRESREDIEGIIRDKYGIDTVIRWNNMLGNLEQIRFYEEGVSERINQNNIQSYADRIINELSFTPGLSVAQLRLREITDVKYMPALNISYDQTFHGVPVENSGFSVEILKKKVGAAEKDHVRIALLIYPIKSLPTEPELDHYEATKIGDDLLRRTLINYDTKKASDVSLIRDPRLVVYPARVYVNNRHVRYDYYLSWRLDYQERAGIYINALSGEIVREGVGPIP